MGNPFLTLLLDCVMNEEILHLYQGLTAQARASTLHHFRQSPRVLRYLQLLEEGITATPRLVAQIYDDVAEQVRHTTLINRFYKLRSRARVWLLRQMQYHEATQTEEEQELIFLRMLVIKGEHWYALPKLQALVERCWTYNIFELLPELLHLVIRAGYACDGLPKETIKDLSQQLQEANRLLYLLNQLKQTFKHLALHIEEYPSKIAAVRRQIKDLKAYPRFELFYRYIAFCMGVHRQDLVDRTSGAMMRHLNAFKQLQEIHPNVPIDLEPQNDIHTVCYFCRKEAIFWYYKGKTKRCMEALKKRQQILRDNPNFIANISVNNLHNMIYFCMNAKEYQLALVYIKEYEVYLDRNQAEYLEAPHFAYEMLVYINAFPQLSHPNPEVALQKMEAFIQQATESSAWLTLTLSEFALLYGDLDRAAYGIQHPYFEQHAKRYAPHTIYTDQLVALVEAQDVAGLEALIGAIQQELDDKVSPTIQFHYETTLRIAKHCRQQLY